MTDGREHTRGPWRMEVEDPVEDVHSGHLYIVGDGRTVAEVGLWNDATLIAQAPDLLAERDRLKEALGKARDAFFLETNGNVEQSRHWPLLKEAIAVLVENADSHEGERNG